MSEISTATCTVCSRSECWSSRHAAGCAMTWHVYEMHPQVWKNVIGDQPPRDPRPETVGHPEGEPDS